MIAQIEGGGRETGAGPASVHTSTLGKSLFEIFLFF